MRWVKASERQPQASDGDVCCDVVCRRYEKSVDGVAGWAVWLWKPLPDGPLDPEDQWLESAFDDKPTFFEAVKMIERQYPKRNEMKEIE